MRENPDAWNLHVTAVMTILKPASERPGEFVIRRKNGQQDGVDPRPARLRFLCLGDNPGCSGPDQIRDAEGSREQRTPLAMDIMTRTNEIATGLQWARAQPEY